MGFGRFGRWTTRSRAAASGLVVASVLLAGCDREGDRSQVAEHPGTRATVPVTPAPPQATTTPTPDVPQPGPSAAELVRPPVAVTGGHTRLAAGAETRDETFVDGTRVCRAVAGPRYIGAVCTDGSSRGTTPELIEELLDGDPLPECWHEEMTADELASMGLRDPGAGSRYYWVKCLHGIDPDTYEVDDEGALIDIGFARLPWERVVEVTDKQQRLIDHLGENRHVPLPTLGYSPAPHPLVNRDLSFYNAAALLGNAALELTLDDLGVSMRAEVVQITVDTGQDAAVTCPGNGYRAEPGQDPQNTPHGCWYAYTDSSLGLPQDAFDSGITAVWNVEIDRGDGWEHFHAFEVDRGHRTQVNEIQAVLSP